MNPANLPMNPANVKMFVLFLLFSFLKMVCLICSDIVHWFQVRISHREQMIVKKAFTQIKTTTIQAFFSQSQTSMFGRIAQALLAQFWNTALRKSAYEIVQDLDKLDQSWWI